MARPSSRRSRRAPRKPSNGSGLAASRLPSQISEEEREVFFWREKILAAVDADPSVADDYHAYFRSDFFSFLRWANIEDPKELRPERRSKPFILWPDQRRLATFLLDAYRAGRNPLVNKSREIGATWLAAAILYWLWWSEEKFSALVMSRKEDLVDSAQTDSIFGKLRHIHGCMPAFMKPKVEDHYLIFVNTENGSYITGESTNTGAGRSGRYAVVLCDEWAHVDHRKQAPIRRGLESVARSWWRVSTPNGKGDDFHAACIAAEPDNLMQISWRADPRRTDDWFDGLLLENGGRLSWDERAQEYACDFSGVSGVRILKAERDKIVYREKDLPLNARRDLMMFAAMDFGSGPSWTVCLFFIVKWTKPRPQIWLDNELVFQRLSAGEIGKAIMELRQLYATAACFVGDPAGRNAESDQESWESNLRAAGVPLSCLDANFNMQAMIDETLRDVQRMLDSGHLLIHERCKIALEAIESWEYDIPAGLSLELVNKTLLKPKKNAWSHPGDALRYGVGAMLRMDPMEAQRVEDMVEEMPKSAAGEIMALFDRAMGGGAGW